jgi:hypothetical protein
MTEKMRPEAISSSPEGSSSPSGPEQVPEWLGTRLRQMFTEVMSEPVPDEFVELLKKLDDKDKERG